MGQGGSTGVPLAIGGAQAGLAGYSAYQQNKAIGRSMGSARRSTDVTLDQLDEAADVEARKTRSSTALVRGRLRSIAAEANLDFAGSFMDAERQADIDEVINLSIQQRNLFNARRRVVSDYQAAVLELLSGRANPLVAGAAAGLQGYQTGLAIQSSLPPGQTGPAPYAVQGSYTGAVGGTNRPR